MLTVGQCRAARGLLDWSAQDLADAAHVGVATVRRFEGGAAIQPQSLSTIRSAFEAAGITFVADGEVSRSGGEGVRLATRSRGAT
jgi:transcriptional regulator with XRE-family HTH domain